MLTGSGRPCYNAVTQGAINSLPHRWSADFDISSFLEILPRFSRLHNVCVCGRGGPTKKRGSRDTILCLRVWFSEISNIFLYFLHVFFCASSKMILRVLRRESESGHTKTAHMSPPPPPPSLVLSSSLLRALAQKAPIWCPTTWSKLSKNFFSW